MEGHLIVPKGYVLAGALPDPRAHIAKYRVPIALFQSHSDAKVAFAKIDNEDQRDFEIVMVQVERAYPHN